MSNQGITKAGPDNLVEAAWGIYMNAKAGTREDNCEIVTIYMQPLSSTTK
jgi:hypothetical protein